MRLIRFLLLFAVLLCLPLRSGAQAPPDTTTEHKGLVFATAGGAYANVTSLNRFLDAFNLPQFTAVVPSVGGGAYLTIGDHVMVGAQGHFYRWGTALTEAGYIRLRGGYALVTGGYSFQPISECLPDLRVYPLIGVGAGSFRFRISGEGQSFAEVLDAPQRGVTLLRESLLVSAGVGVEHQFLRDSDLHFRLGLQVGYLQAPLATDWKIGNATVNGGPDAGLGGPFIRFLLGRGP